MAGAKGNKNALGKRHPGRGGRPSAYQERANAEALFSAFFEDTDVTALSAKVASGKYSIWDMTRLKALAGNERIQSAMLSRVFPEKFEHAGKDGGPIVIVRAERGESRDQAEDTPG